MATETDTRAALARAVDEWRDAGGDDTDPESVRALLPYWWGTCVQPRDWPHAWTIGSSTGEMLIAWKPGCGPARYTATWSGRNERGMLTPHSEHSDHDDLLDALCALAAAGVPVRLEAGDDTTRAALARALARALDQRLGADDVAWDLDCARERIGELTRDGDCARARLAEAEAERDTLRARAERLARVARALAVEGKGDWTDDAVVARALDVTDAARAALRPGDTDARDTVGEKHEGCEYFVLDLDHDPLALPAVDAYMHAARAAGYDRLAEDLRLKVAMMRADAKERARAAEARERALREAAEAICRTDATLGETLAQHGGVADWPYAMRLCVRGLRRALSAAPAPAECPGCAALREAGEVLETVLYRTGVYARLTDEERQEADLAVENWDHAAGRAALARPAADREPSDD